MKDQVANLVVFGSVSSSKRIPSRKNKRNNKFFLKRLESQIRKETKCFFCNKMRLFKWDCPKRKGCFHKKVNIKVLFAMKENLVEMSSITWRLKVEALSIAHLMKVRFLVASKTRSHFQRKNEVGEE